MSRLRDAADMLSVGAELLTEFADWIEEGGPRTFGEWLLKVDCPEAERPPIVTPPPKKTPDYPPEMRRPPAPKYDPFFHANQVLIVLHRLIQMRGVDYMRDVVSDAWKYRCQHCGDVLIVERLYTIDGARIDDAGEGVYITKVRTWYREHGVNCGRVTIERGAWIDYHPGS